MNHTRGCGIEPVYLGRQGHRHGPYSWEDIRRFAEEGNLLADDLLWSPSLIAWTRASDFDGLKAVAGRSSWQPSRSLLVGAIATYGIVVVIAIAVALWLNLRSPSIEVEDYFPKEGAAGSYVIVALSGSVEPADVEISYRGATALSLRGLTAKHVGLHIPLDQGSGELKVSWRGRELAALPFTVLPAAVTIVHQERIRPSAVNQSFETKEGISLTVPGGLLTRETELTISKVAHPAVYREDPFSEPEVYDISIEGMDQLTDFVEIGIPYDPTLLDASLPAEAQFSPARWDPEREAWVDLHYRVDESTGTLYVISDHLSYFLTGFSLVGLGKTAVVVAIVGVAIAETVERWANDKYLSRDWKIRVLYSDKALRATFPDDRWQKVMAGARLRMGGGYDPTYASAVQDIAFILEESLKCYVAAGFPDPTRKGIWGANIYTRYVKVKIDSLYNYATGGEMTHENFWDTIHLPTEILKLQFFNEVESGTHPFEQNFTSFKAGLAHELFHAFQVPYYGLAITFQGTEHKWWREATAEWAAFDLAQIAYRPGWNQDSPMLMTRIASGFLRHPVNSLGKIDGTAKVSAGLEYEYLAAVFIRYLVRERGFTFKELVQQVAQGDRTTDPLVILRYLAGKSLTTMDRVYLDFAVWLLTGSQLPLSDFQHPDNTDIVAEKCDAIKISEAKATVMLSHSSTPAAEMILVFKGSDGHEQLSKGQKPAVVFEESGRNYQELEVADGDILYFLCANGLPENRSVTLTIEEKSKDERRLSGVAAEPWKKVAQHAMSLEKNGTAGVWAVKISTGAVTIEPTTVTDAVGYREYPFKVSVSGLKKETSAITLEYDFGDGCENARGSVETAVVGGKAEVELKHRYEPSPAVKAEDKPLTHTLTVKVAHDGASVGSAEAKVTVKQAELGIQPPRTIVLELPEGVSESSERFVALAEPAGTYRYEWDFGDGQSASDPDRSDGRSEASHVFTGLQVGDSFQPAVKLYDSKGKLLAQDRISVTVEEAGARARFVLVDKKVVSVRKPLWANFSEKDVPDDSPWSIGADSASSTADYEERERFSGPYQDRSEWIRTFSARFRYSWGPFPREIRAQGKIPITLRVDDAGTSVRYSKGSHQLKLETSSMFEDEQRASIMLLAGEGKGSQFGVASARAAYEIGKGSTGPGQTTYEFASDPDWTYDEGDTYLFHVTLEQNLIQTRISYTYRYTTH